MHYAPSLHSPFPKISIYPLPSREKLETEGYTELMLC